MIASIRGILTEKKPGRVVVEANGIGMEIYVTPSSSELMPEINSEIKLFTAESTAMYGGGTTLYGFLTAVEKDIFELLREMPGTGAKKAMEYLDKINKSIADFQRAIINRDFALLTTVFGFRKPTAEKLISNLKDKISSLKVVSAEKWSSGGGINVRRDAVAVLAALGYKDAQSKSAVEDAAAELSSDANVQEIVRLALKKI